jgi:hypothetical protein
MNLALALISRVTVQLHRGTATATRRRTMSNRRSAFERAVALAALSGFKVALGPAFLAASKHSSNTGTWALAAMGEMFLDKLGILPSRFRPTLLIPHALSGAWVAHESMRQDGVEDPTAPLAGAVVAAGVSCVAPICRIALHRGFGISDALLGLGEDYLALRLGTQATDVSMSQVTKIARHAIEEVTGPLFPSLPSTSSTPELSSRN